MDKRNTPIGLIGLGLLGSAMAHRLLSQGYSVLGYDLAQERQEAFSEMGGQALRNAGQIFDSCEIVLLSLPTSDVAADLLQQSQQNFSEDQIVIDTTTGHPDQMETIAKELLKQQLIYLEATVAGSSEQMRLGEAMLFIGGQESVVHTMGPLWSALAKTHFYLGPAGAASRFKLVHNLVLGLHRAVLAEGLSFAESLGFNPQTTLDVLQQTPAASDTMTTKGQKMVDRDWRVQARLSQHLKDVRLILEMAKQTQSSTPLSQLHRELLEQAEQLGFGEADNSSIFEVFTQPRS